MGRRCRRVAEAPKGDDRVGELHSFCLWQGGTRRPSPSVTFALCGDQRTPSKLCSSASCLPRAGGSDEYPQPPHGQGAQHDLLHVYGRGAIYNSRNRKVQTPCHADRGTTAAVAEVCAARGNFWQPTNHPIIRLASCFVYSSPPRRTTSAAHSTAARAYTRRTGDRTPPRATPCAPLR